LTSLGEEVGRNLKDKHEILAEFLVKVLQLDEDIALKDACSIEHYLHPKTVDRVVKLLGFLKAYPGESGWIDKFKEFLDKKI